MCHASPSTPGHSYAVLTFWRVENHRSYPLDFMAQSILALRYKVSRRSTVNASGDINQAGTADDVALDPREAATLLEQARRHGATPVGTLPGVALRDQSGPGPLRGRRGWFSVRGQHPYQGPTGAAILVLVPVLAINFVATLAVARRATAGVSGRSRLRPAEIAVMVVVWVGVFAVMVPGRRRSEPRDRLRPGIR